MQIASILVNPQQALQDSSERVVLQSLLAQSS